MSKQPVILVIDDEPDHADGIAEALEKVCAKAIAVYSGADALEILRDQRVDVVVTDLKLGDGLDGLRILEQVKKTSQQTEVILITAYATIETCKQAIKKGAYDYLVKPIDVDQLRTLVEQAGRKVSVAVESAPTRPASDSGQFRFEGIWGTSARMKGILEVLRRVSPTNISILVEGPSGTGKELLARAIHDNSRRAGKPFKPINCAGLAETLLESELFGHVKGAFTGAAADRKGLFEQANKGVLFLDEIGDMPLNMQAKLLRVLEDGIVVPVGSSNSVVVDVRFISATNHDLTQLVAEKKFRQDLYYRIKGVNIVLPSLRERAEDIPLLCDYFIKEAISQTGSKVTGITDAAVSILSSYDWPGNIRQLRNCIRTMVVMCDTNQLDVGDVPLEISQRRQLGAGQAAAAGLAGMPLDELEKQAIIETLKKTGNNREKAAKILGIGERTLYRKIKEYNL